MTLGPRDFRPTIRRRGVQAVWSAIHAVGADRGWAHKHAQSGATILMYHAVTDAENRRWIDPKYAATLHEFEAQMAYLATHRSVIGLRELVSMISAGQTPPAGTVVITFDDGYLCTLRLAAPVLRRHNLPATLFLPTALIDRTEALWVDQLYSMFNTRRTSRVRLNGAVSRGFDLDSRRSALEAYHAIGRFLLAADSTTRDETLHQIAAQLSPTVQPPRVMMTWEDAARWLEASPGFEIGAHTREHIDLSACSPERLEEEVRGSVDDLQRRLGVTSPHFSCPYGRGGDRAGPVAKDAGCRSLVLTEPMSRITAESDVFALTRVNAPPRLGPLGFLTSGAYPEMSHRLLGRA